MRFDELALAEPLLRAVHDQEYEKPTPIQAEAIPLILAGHDVLGGAQTGTGKTAAFVLPMLHRLAHEPAPKVGRVPRALVLCPTRELAAQVEQSVRTYGKYLTLRSAVVFGGVGMNPQIAALRRGVDILVATPGRLLDLLQQGMVRLDQVQMLVLDEADRMLDMGFIHDVRKLLVALPAKRQSLLFSATFSEEIRALASTLLKQPRSVQVTPKNSTVQRITQEVYSVARNKKQALLAHILVEHGWNQVLVFTRTKHGANTVAEYLEDHGIEALAMHGNKSQSARIQALEGFRRGRIRALVATDIAARGLDIDELPHVVNFDIPNVTEDYVHRIGRTGRAGNEGTAISLVSRDEEGFMEAIERFTHQSVPVRIVPEFAPPPDEVALPIAMGRQTLWGGLGKPPSRAVMQAAARQARAAIQQRQTRSQAGAKGPKPAATSNPSRRPVGTATPSGPKTAQTPGQREGQRRGQANHPEQQRHAQQRSGAAKNHGHHNAGGVERHQAQPQGLAVSRRRRDGMQGTQNHGLHSPQRKTQRHRT